jgi:hypothetical protein
MTSYLAVDELEITRALRVTVTSTVLGTGLVGRVLAHTTVLIHADEVDSAVQPARQLAEIDIEGKFVAKQCKHGILAR